MHVDCMYVTLSFRSVIDRICMLFFIANLSSSDQVCTLHGKFFCQITYIRLVNYGPSVLNSYFLFSYMLFLQILHLCKPMFKPTVFSFS